VKRLTTHPPTAPLVMLHGFTGGPESWRRVRNELGSAWSQTAPIVPCLAGHGKHTAVERRHGEHASAAPSKSTGPFGAEVDRLAHLCRTRGISVRNPCVLVGYSLGARLALGLLVTSPELFRAAVLVGVNPGLPTEQERQERRVQDERLADLALREGLGRFLEHWENLPLFRTQAHLPDAVLRSQAELRRQNTANGLAHSLRTCGLGQMPNYLESLSSVDLPVHLVAGALDQRFVELAQQMALSLSQSSIHIVADCGHNVPLEAPAALARLIEASLP
jgi:2-succinyl-6-hydroxy-2,4-cyclohexadiene-1-carboxylate synthase